ncbi:MAG: hypothetical protein ACJ798_06235, partial [Phenylobacterium sp.]
MLRRPILLAALAAMGLAGAAAGQPGAPAPAPPPAAAPGQGVQVTALAAPDAFTAPGRATGLPQTLWP